MNGRQGNGSGDPPAPSGWLRRSPFNVRGFCLSAAVCLAAAAANAASPHDPIGTKVTWEREIAPIVQARCVSCHAPNGPAPMSLATYDDARPWAKAIREEVLARRMPKWHVVRGYGDFVNDPSLSAFEIALITAWVDGGSPRMLAATGTTTSPPVPIPPGAAIARTIAQNTRSITVPCTAKRLEGGRIVGLRPALDKGDSVRVSVVDPDAGTEPLLWLRDFDPAYATTYWLRTPREVSSRTRLEIQASRPCRITVLLEAGTER